MNILIGFLLSLFIGSAVAAEGDVPIEQSNGRINTQTISGDVTLTAAGVATVQAVNGVATRPWQYERTITSPADTDDWLWFKAEAVLTIVSVSCVAQGTTPSITVDIQECDSDGANCSTSLSSAITCDGGNNTGTITDSTIDSGDWVKMLLGAPSGTVDAVSVQIAGTRAL
jgi:hypothetical protein